ncbi:shikimate dehydrogenase family protein [Anaerolinea thermophila]|uniref:Shikimate dehydrogenase (NADP(+)) n=1 Tax=Anaerolinea thermophila (strain DSM 14523 / JCM 11388 / NBRC 100420 / UNI-1) TaxID=926569 RepID=E8MZ81_ANATU|nr:shikimate dehydrogenase [Anaerolinea thermophila]BAJ62224.1 shikimate dehydrogenase [Anaerolinea thermophila UNI-1]
MSALCLGLLGFPLGHSLSPRLHTAALSAMGLEGEYRLYPVPPLPEGETAWRALFERLRAGDLHGLNVTIPHKQTVMKELDFCEDEARIIGAVNTLGVDDSGRVWGANTDSPGFLRDLYAQLGDVLPLQGGRALVLGAGGAARAVVYALIRAEWEVWVSARRGEQAQTLAESLRTFLPYAPLTALEGVPPREALPPRLNLLVNATPLGMSPHPDTLPWNEALPIPEGTAVYDLVYNPRETRLLAFARACGAPAAGGLGMLVEQAALALERWSGQMVPRSVMWQVVAEDSNPQT